MKTKKKDRTPMEVLTEGYEKYIKGKETENNGKQAFNNTIKKAAKQRGAK